MLALYLSLLESPLDRASFHRIYRENYDAMMAAAQRYFPEDHTAAEDVVHNSFLRMIENYSAISQVPQEKLPTYILIMVKNEAIDMQRKQKRVMSLEDCAPIEAPVPRDEADVLAVIRSMPENYRALLELRFVLGLGYQEIVDRLGLTLPTVTGRISRGRKLLIEKLKEEGYTP